MDHSSTCVSDLFLDHRETLVHTLFRIVGCRQTAEDLAQEAYIRVMSAAEDQHVTYLKAFLNQTARNLALDHLRKAKVRARTDCPDADRLRRHFWRNLLGLPSHQKEPKIGDE
jgi:RNA polymerase sigma factor (sigma-70 family)